MRKQGNVFAYEAERDADLMRAYREDISACRRIVLEQVWERLSRAPAKRFWVSEEQATIIVRRLMKGDPLTGMRPNKREMFLEIYKRVLELQQQFPGKSLFALCARVVAGPAPRFYMTPQSIRQTYYKIKRKWKKQR